MRGVQKHTEGEAVGLVVDSGTSETVVVEEVFRRIPTRMEEDSKNKAQHEVANGVRTLNPGENKPNAFAEDGGPRAITSQVCDARCKQWSIACTMSC